MASRTIVRFMRSSALVLTSVWAVVGSPSEAIAQDEEPEEEEEDFPVVGGGEFRFGLAFPGDANQGWSLGVDLDLGPIFPGFRAFAGYTGLLGADVDRVLRGEPLRGDLSAHGVRGGTRVDLARDQTVVPYVSVALLIYRASTRALEPEDAADLRDLYGGNRLGGSIALGATYPLEDTEQIVAVAELRRAYISAVGNWSLDAGVRIELLDSPE